MTEIFNLVLLYLLKRRKMCHNHGNLPQFILRYSQRFNNKSRCNKSQAVQCELLNGKPKNTNGWKLCPDLNIN